MKIWIKLLVGSALGFLLGFLLPAGSEEIKETLAYFAKLAVNIGRYTAVPLIVFSITIAIYELRQDKMFWKTVLYCLCGIVCISIFVVVFGMAAALIFTPERIPIFKEQEAASLTLEPALNLLEMFPSNMLQIFSSSGTYLFPLCVFAFFLALGLSYDKNYTKPVISLIDSLSRIFYHISVFFSEILCVLLIAISAYWAVQYHDAIESNVFKTIMLLLFFLSLGISFIVLPLFLYIIKKYRTPWKAVYAGFGSALSAFFSGDINFALPLLIRETKENLGIRRRANIVFVMLWSTFGRAGSAMTAAISLLVIIKSYSSLEIAADELFSIAMTAVLISFLLGRNPGDGVFAALASLCARYGHGYDTGYLILKPIAFYLVSIGALIDVMIISLGTFALSRIMNFQSETGVNRFI